MNNFINSLVDRHNASSQAVTPLTRSRFERGEEIADLTADPVDEVDTPPAPPEALAQEGDKREPSAVPLTIHQQSSVNIQEVQLDIERTLETIIYREQARPTANINPQTKDSIVRATDPKFADEPIAAVIPSPESEVRDNQPVGLDIFPVITPKKGISAFPISQQSPDRMDSGRNDEWANRARIKSESPSPTIKINIGRIEVRAQQQPKPAVAKKPRAQRQPNLTLEDYLKKRK